MVVNLSGRKLGHILGQFVYLHAMFDNVWQFVAKQSENMGGCHHCYIPGLLGLSKRPGFFHDLMSEASIEFIFML
jgi:hypothetical protein